MIMLVLLVTLVVVPNSVFGRMQVSGPFKRTGATLGCCPPSLTVQVDFISSDESTDRGRFYWNAEKKQSARQFGNFLTIYKVRKYCRIPLLDTINKEFSEEKDGYFYNVNTEKDCLLYSWPLETDGDVEEVMCLPKNSYVYKGRETTFQPISDNSEIMDVFNTEDSEVKVSRYYSPFDDSCIPIATEFNPEDDYPSYIKYDEVQFGAPPQSVFDVPNVTCEENGLD